MKNKLKKFVLIVAICISMFFSGSAFAGIEDGVRNSVNVAKMEFATKAPFGKRQMVMKFVLAMLGVATSSVIIYVGLSVYNKFFFNNRMTVVVNEDDNDFKTPTNMKEAINIFLKKTK